MPKDKNEQPTDNRNKSYDQWRNSNNQDAMPKSRTPPQTVPGRPSKK